MYATGDPIDSYLSFAAYSTSMAHRSRIKWPYLSRNSIPFCVCRDRFSNWSCNENKMDKLNGGAFMLQDSNASLKITNTVNNFSNISIVYKFSWILCLKIHVGAKKDLSLLHECLIWNEVTSFAFARNIIRLTVNCVRYHFHWINGGYF